jgi:signal transduction histidine kinase
MKQTWNLKLATWNWTLKFGIRYRLLLPLGLLLIGVIGASLWSAHVAARKAEERVAGQVRSISQTLQNANYPLKPFVIEQMKGYSGAEFLFIPPSEPPVATFRSGAPAIPADSAFDGVDESSIGPIVRVNGEEYRCRRLVLKAPNPQAGGVVYIYYPETLLEEAIADAQRPSLLGLLFGFVAVILTFGIGQRLVGRIRALEKRTRQIAGGDFSPMPLPSANDELRDLTISVNEMADRLAKLHQAVARTERLRLTTQLASGLAHQLRNGVTGAKLAVQVYLSEHPDENSEALAVTLRQLTLMELNLRRFIDLGRPAASKREDCSLNAILTDVIELHRPRCKHAGIELRCELPVDDVKINGSADQLGDLFVNLIGNAVDAVGSGGEVTVNLHREGNNAVVEISDTGLGPSPEIVARLFEPFVTGKPEGIGLGLAVAKHAAEAHGGNITWKRDGKRTVFRVELPA